MTTQTEALKLALEALTATMSTHGFKDAIDEVHDKAITAIKEALAQQSNEQVDKQTVTVLPDGSAFAIASYPLPETHWLYAKREYADGEDEPIELGKPILTHEVRDAVISAVRYAVRGATMCGKESDFDPDALVQNAVYALCGPYTPVAHPPVPTAQPELQTCNCRWDGEVQVQQCTLHESHVDAVHEWAERAKTAEAKLNAQPKEPEQRAQLLFEVDGEMLTASQMMGVELFNFQQATGCDTAAEFLAQPAVTESHKRTWVGLTDEEIDALREKHSEGRGAGWRFDFKGFARAIEAAHGIKE